PPVSTSWTRASEQLERRRQGGGHRNTFRPHPGVGSEGSATTSETGSELPPPGPGLTTVRLRDPASATSSGLRLVLSSPELTNVVARGSDAPAIDGRPTRTTESRT